MAENTVAGEVHPFCRLGPMFACLRHGTLVPGDAVLESASCGVGAAGCQGGCAGGVQSIGSPASHGSRGGDLCTAARARSTGWECSAEDPLAC